jgi:hypothetical protein
MEGEMRRSTRCGAWMDGRRGGYCTCQHRKGREARGDLEEWVEEKELSP